MEIFEGSRDDRPSEDLPWDHGFSLCGRTPRFRSEAYPLASQFVCWWDPCLATEPIPRFIPMLWQGLKGLQRCFFSHPMWVQPTKSMRRITTVLRRQIRWPSALCNPRCLSFTRLCSVDLNCFEFCCFHIEPNCATFESNPSVFIIFSTTIFLMKQLF